MKESEFRILPAITGLSLEGNEISLGGGGALINILAVFEPVSVRSILALKLLEKIAKRYSNTPVEIIYIMEPRLSCFYKPEAARKFTNRLGISSKTIYDSNSTVSLQLRLSSLPAVFIADSNLVVHTYQEGEISTEEIERFIQFRLSSSGFRDELPEMVGIIDESADHSLMVSRPIVRQMGYASNDYLFNYVASPEALYEFPSPGLCASEMLYPSGQWFVGRDFIQGEKGSAIYINCSRDESLWMFAGSDEGCKLTIQATVDLQSSLQFGKDVLVHKDSVEMIVKDCQQYEILSFSGQEEVLLNLNVESGSLKIYSVEFLLLSHFPVSEGNV
ncbi:MAG: TlpA family protein disulfide reductase [Candidatus Kryptoniota bacterium]